MNEQMSMFEDLGITPAEDLNLPEGCERSFADLKRYDDETQYMFHSQANQKALEDMIHTITKDRKFCFGFVWGNYNLKGLPRSYVLEQLRDNIIKESIVQLTIRFINEKKFKLPNVEGSVMTISTKEKGEYINAINKANQLFEKLGYTGSCFILKE